MRKKVAVAITIWICVVLGLFSALYDMEQQIIALNIKNRTPTKGLFFTVEIHVDMYHYRNGELLAHSHHAGTLTNSGADYIEGKLGAVGFANETAYATYIGLSNSTSSPSATWNILPSEITTGGMGRANGTYTGTGTGTWNMSNTFSPSETNSTRLVGLYWNSYAGGLNSLLASDTITAINYQSGDSVEIVWSITAS